jgi:hypothetical protein
MSEDCIENFAAQLTRAREDAAAAVDRADALAELVTLSRAAAGDLRSAYLTVDQFWATASSEEERAHLTALLDRAADPNRNGDAT